MLLVVGRRRLGLTAACACLLPLLLLARPAAGREREPPTAADGEVVWSVTTGQPEVAITFDDGPDPQNTPAVLAALRRRRAVATFFVLGSAAVRWPDLLRAAVAEGSEVCNHGWSHTLLSGRSADFVAREVTRTAAVLSGAGVPACRLFRFPYFASDASARRTVTELGYRIVAANVDPQDWRDQAAERIVRYVCERAHAGDIILLHDGGGPRAQSVAALDTILAELSARGLRFVTVSRLLAQARPLPPAGE